MSRIVWGAPGSRFYESGVSCGVLFLSSGLGVAWNGLTAVNERASGDMTPYYLDGIKYINVVGVEDFSATIDAYSCPPEFYELDGMPSNGKGLIITGQPRKPFNFSYRTEIGNDLSQEAGYKLHLVYNALSSPSDKNNETTTDTTSPLKRSWAIETVPPAVPGYKPTAHLIIDSTKTDPDAMSAIEEALYGDNDFGYPPMILTPAEIIQIMGYPHGIAYPSPLTKSNVPGAGGTYNNVDIPVLTGVDYRLDGINGTIVTGTYWVAVPVTIFATPKPGYYLADGYPTSWAFTHSTSAPA